MDNAKPEIITNPETRYQLYAVLFQGFGPYTPGIDLSQLLTQLQRKLGNDCWPHIDGPLRQLADLLSSVVRPTYAVTSYLGPFGQRRQSIIHRDWPIDEQGRKSTLAFTYAFYSLTLTGRKLHLYSATQYILEAAKNKWSLPLCFAKRTPRAADQWWHIPDWLDGALLQDTGIQHEIESRILRNGAQLETSLADALQSLLANKNEKSLVDIDQFGNRCIGLFDNATNHPSQALLPHVAALGQYLADMFGETQPLPQRLVMFMLMTYLVWRRAYPETRFAYTFPVLIRDHPCVLTIGTDSPLKPKSAYMLSSLARAAFAHPLTSDYAEYAARKAAADERAKNLALIVEKMHAHKTDLPWVNTRLETCGQSLERGDLANARLQLHEIRNTMRKITEADFSILEQYRTEYDSVRLADIIEHARLRAVALGLSCKVESEETFVFVRAEEEELKRQFAELVINAWYHCAPGKGTLLITVKKDVRNLGDGDADVVLIHFEDNGTGVPDAIKPRIFEEGFTTRSLRGGSGYGLSVARNRIQGFGGQLTVHDARSGTGTLFEICLLEA